MTSKTLLDKYRVLIYLLIIASSHIAAIFCQNLHNLSEDNSNKIIKLVDSFVIETEVDPKAYILGPGDKIGLSIITSNNIAYTLNISPTGHLWIPDVGLVHISGMNIEKAQSKVEHYIQKNRYKSADILLVLLNIRHFKVQIMGAIMNPDMVIVSSVDRLTDAIKKSGGLHKLADEELIIISRKNHEDIKCSLRSYRLNGKPINNPIVQEGDVIFVPFLEDYRLDIEEALTHKENMIFVTGLVLKPSGHKYIPGYGMDDYLAMSGGISDYGSKYKIVIYRNGEHIKLQNVNALQPGDHINVPANIKYKMLGNMSMLQTLTSMMTLYLTYQAATN